jgi:hypothetical protein
MKKIILLWIILMTIFIIPFQSVKADIGPKRTLDVKVIGVDQPYFLDILVRDQMPADITYIQEHYHMLPNMIWTYNEDGFISNIISAPWGSPMLFMGENHYRDGYHAPSRFKLILIFEDESYITSDIITTKLFNSRITWDLSGIDLTTVQNGVGDVSEEWPIAYMSIDLIVRIVLTILIEIAVLYVFGYRLKESFKLVLYINIVTQTILTGFVIAMRYFYFPFLGEIFVLIVGEFFIFIIEITLFVFFLREFTKKKAALYGFVANLISLMAGFLFLMIFYMILSYL